jgi:hypothetical protein
VLQILQNLYLANYNLLNVDTSEEDRNEQNKTLIMARLSDYSTTDVISDRNVLLLKHQAGTGVFVVSTPDCPTFNIT